MAGVACVVVAAVKSPASIEDGPILCPFRLLTGLECPGCGLTRAWVYAMHGQWNDSFTSNPFGILLMLFVLVFAAATVRRRVQARPAPDLDRLVRHPMTLVVLGVWILFGVGRVVLSVLG